MYARIESENLRLSLERDDEVVAHMRCNPSQFVHAICPRELDVDQAIPHAARISSCCRGKNAHSIRFKEKLRARRSSLYVYVNICDRLTGNRLSNISLLGSNLPAAGLKSRKFRKIESGGNTFAKPLIGELSLIRSFANCTITLVGTSLCIRKVGFPARSASTTFAVTF